MAPLIFYGENFQLWIVMMEIYFDDLDLWKAIEEHYKINLLSNNQTVARIRRLMRQDHMVEGDLIVSHKSHGKFLKRQDAQSKIGKQVCHEVVI